MRLPRPPNAARRPPELRSTARRPRRRQVSRKTGSARGEVLRARYLVIEAHSDLVSLEVELTLNHPLGRAYIECMRCIEEVFGVEVQNPVLRQRVGRAEIHGCAFGIPNVPGFLAADRE